MLKTAVARFLLVGEGQSVGNDKFVTKTLQQNINPKNSLL